MSRIASLLHPDEYPLIETRSHLASLIRPALITILALFAAAALGFVFSPDRGSDAVDIVSGLAALVVSLRFAWRVIDRARTTVVLTDLRILVVRGVLARSVASLPLSRVGDVSYSRSILGRVLGYGAIEVSGRRRGEDPRMEPWLRADQLPNPDHFYRTLAASVAARAPRPEEGSAVPFDEADTGQLPRVVV